MLAAVASAARTTEGNDMRTAKVLDPIPPGEILMEEFLRPLGISINALARDLAVPANRISGIINGTRAITADTALRLGKYFGVSPELWLDLQSDYELRVARQTTWPHVGPSVKTRMA
jgi:addiction module HigA family antidote